MNSIIINFDNTADINKAYNKLKKLYPENKIAKFDIDIDEIIEDEYLLFLTLEREKKGNGKFYSEAEVMRELGITERDIENAEELEIE